MSRLTRSFRETVQARVKKDSAFREALFQEAIDCMLSGDIDTGKSVLRDYINATVGFEALSKVVDKPAKSLMRMLSPTGNPQARNLFTIIAFLQKHDGFRIEAKTAK
jgi:hypothetical protein